MIDLTAPLRGRTALLLAAAFAGFTVGRASFGRPASVGNPRVPQPARPVQLTRYLGTWYEIARYESWFERGCEAATAEYALLPDGLIRVVNTCRDKCPSGRLRSSEGKAKIVPGSGNAKLKVSFFGRLFYGDYWVLDHSDDYEWSIVGEPRGKYLWILHRDPTPGAETIATLVARARQLGYDTTRLHMTRQPPL